MADYIYVDNSNLFIEGKRVSAVVRGLAMNIFDAMNNRIIDFDYTLSFGRLHEFIAGTDHSQIARAVLFGSRPPPNDGIWVYAKKAGFELILEDRNVKNKEKKIDTGIVSAMCRDAYRLADATKDTFVLVGGDADFVPAVRQLVEDGFKVEVAFWDHCSKELREVASSFLSLNEHLEFLRLKY
ncbi:MAG TPA: NYN domain-containing protein [Urbifossiella sp.]|nr:NYN domain-containing protein [Urbifossiella sp.]